MIHSHLLHRRQFFQRSGLGLGALALGSLLREASAAVGDPLAPMENPLAQEGNPLAPKPPHFAARAKRVIYLHMIGAPSQLDLFDPKPELVKRDGEKCPESLLAGKRFA